MMSEVENEERLSYGVGMWIMLGGGLVAGAAGVYWFWRYFYWEKVNNRVSEILSSQIENNDAWGQVGAMGDSFGALSALFAGIGVVVSAIAFFGFIYALKMQRDDLNLQRNEMKRTRKVMEHQANISAEQLSLVTQQIISAALPSHVEIMHKAFEKSGAKQSDIQNAIAAFTAAVNTSLELRDFQKRHLKNPEYERCALRHLCFVDGTLDALSAWLNVIFMWEERIRTMPISVEQKMEYEEYILRCCTKDERLLIYLAKIKHGKINFGDKTELSKLCHVLYEGQNVEPIDNLKLRMYVACEVLHKNVFSLLYNWNDDKVDPYVEEVRQVVQSAIESFSSSSML